MGETREKSNLWKKIVLMMCTVVVTITTVLGSGMTEVQATSKTKLVMSAYAKYLYEANWNDNGKYTTFVLLDANNDGVKELVVYDDSIYWFYVYGYVSGKVKYLGYSMRGDIEFYPKKKIFSCDNSPTAGFNSTVYYKYDGKKVKEIAGYSEEYEGVGGTFLGSRYEIGGKKVTKKKYEKYIKSLKLGKGKSSWNLKMLANTAQNRKKYLGFDGMPAGTIAIDNKNFPDEMFRKFISSYVSHTVDGYLLKNELLAVEKMALDDEEIENLKGIEFFTNLEDLDCSYNSIKTLNVSQNTKLRKINCSRCDLSSLDVSNNPYLEELICSNNDISELDLSNNLYLKNLECQTNVITSLDVSKNSNLEGLFCYENNISKLDVSGNPYLEDFCCNNNYIESLDVSNNPKLWEIDCRNNNIKSLDVSNNPNLRRLYCDEDVEILELRVSRAISEQMDNV